MKVYIDSSVVLRRMLQQPGHIEDWRHWDHAVTSALTRLEVRRSLDRLRVQGRLTPEELAKQTLLHRLVTEGFEEAPLRPNVLERAGAPLSAPLGALDAIHLATALLWMEDREEPLTFLTHDRQLALAALTCGLDVVGVPPASLTTTVNEP